MRFLIVVKSLIFLTAFSVLSACACLCTTTECTAPMAISEKPEPLQIGGTSDSSTAGGLRSIHFDYKQTKPLESGFVDLERNVQILKNNPGLVVLIEGHGDRVGSDRYNEGLALERAKVVVSYLVKNGIAENRLRIDSMGRSVPLSGENETSAYELERDRRVNFLVVDLAGKTH